MNRVFQSGQILQFDSYGKFVIEDVVGVGASSVVYRSHHEDASGNSTEHLLKEYNPKRIPLHRDESDKLCLDSLDYLAAFNAGLKRFEDGYRRQLEFRKDTDLKNATSNIQGIYSGYGTKFIDMTCFSGSPYNKIEERSLGDLLHRIKAITQVISCYHKKGYLHLDIKPENIFTFPETCEMVMLFDFDSIVSKNDIRKKDTVFSYTAAWAAPEQLDHTQLSNIRECTDLYAIGMVFFYKLMGRFPHKPEEHRTFGAYSFDITSGLLKNANEHVLSLLTDLFHHTLCTADRRWQTADELIEALDELLDAIKQQGTNSCASVPKNTKDTTRLISVLKRAILVAALLICIPIGFRAFQYFNGNFRIDNQDPQIPSAMETEDKESILSDTKEQQAATLETNANDSHEAGSADEESSISDGSPANDTYAIDTIAYNLVDFRSLILTNDGAVYYLAGDTVLCTESDSSLNLKRDFETPLKNGYLAYDPYNDIVYLITGGSVAIFDITDIRNPKLVFNHDMFPELQSFELRYESLTPQIAILKDGSLLIPADRDGTYRINPQTKIVSPFAFDYSYSSADYSKLVGDTVFELDTNSNEAVVKSLTSSTKQMVKIDIENAPYENYLYALENRILFYEEGVGVCSLSIDGTCDVVVPQNSIAIRDYQTLDRVNIWCLAANEQGTIAFYDNTLCGIRYLWKEG